METFISKPEDWGAASEELALEQLKLRSYDRVLLELCGDVAEKRILDYGSGPGILAAALLERGANISVFDIAEAMRRESAGRISTNRVYSTLGAIPPHAFDIVVCNLVLCIVPDHEVEEIICAIRSLLKPKGVAYFGVCNPHLVDVADSKLDIRHCCGTPYGQNHRYRKTKKEGSYQIVEMHRPIGWYDEAFRAFGFRPSGIYFTDEYELGSCRLRDFAIFRLDI